MATKKLRSTKTKNAPTVKERKPELVTVNEKIQKVHPWFREGCSGVIVEELTRLKEKHRKGIGPVSALRVRRVAAIHEILQRRINALQAEQERFTARLKAHWGRTGITEIESRVGNTLVGTSMSLAIDPRDLQLRIGTDRFMSLVAFTIDIDALFTAAKKDEFLKAAIRNAARVAKSSVSVTAPSSRRAKSGKSVPEVE